MEKLLSIIIIGRNEEINLPDVFRSVRVASQRFKEHFHEEPDILYIDSQSTDNSIEIAQKFKILHLVVEGKTSPGIARNKGVQNTKSRYIFFLDGDTILAEDFLIKGINYLNDHEDAAGVGGKLMFRIFSDGVPKLEFNNYRFIRKDEEEIFDGVGGTLLYRRSEFITAGGFSPELPVGEEFDLLLRVASRKKKLIRLKIPMAIHNDYKSASESFIRRYLLSRNIFIPGRIVKNSPIKYATVRIVFMRYWLHIMYIPLILFFMITMLFRLYSIGAVILFLLLALNFIFKKFSITRSILSCFTMIFYSFGWWTGLFFGSRYKTR